MSDEKRVEDGVVLATPAASLSQAHRLPASAAPAVSVLLWHTPLALAPPPRCSC